MAAKKVLYALYVGKHYTASLPDWLGGKYLSFERGSAVRVTPEEALWLATRFPYTAQMFYFHDRKGEIVTLREIVDLVKNNASDVWVHFVDEGIVDDAGEWLSRVSDYEYRTPAKYPGVREELFRVDLT